jgi:hypothetical protein
MPLSQEDLNNIGDLFDRKVEALEKKFAASLKSMGKRVQRLEDGFGELARVARGAVLTSAKDRHDRLLRTMFDESTLVAVPPLQEDQHGKFSRPAAACSLNDVVNKLRNVVGSEVKFEVEATKVGYRVLLASFSSQSRRQAAATLIKKAKQELQDSLGLLLQYDKPHELRFLQRDAYKFMAVVHKRAKGAVTSKQLKNGFIVINGVRFAPEYLVPGPGRWDALADEVLKKIRSWRGGPPHSPDVGVMTDVFGHAYALDKGVFELEDIDYIETAVSDDDMGEGLTGARAGRHR